MFINELHQGGIRAIVDYDNTVFDNMVVPEDIQLSDVVDRILFKYGDTPLFAPDPAVIKFYIGKWSERRLPLWNRYIEVAGAQYDPIENYDRYESGSDTTELQISADNASTYQPDSKSIRTPDLHIHGNIGVTTAATMQKEILDLLPRFDVIDFIADDFKAEFCLYVY